VRNLREIDFLVKCFVSRLGCFAPVVRCHLTVETCSQTPRRVTKVQHDRQILRKPYFTFCYVRLQQEIYCVLLPARFILFDLLLRLVYDTYFLPKVFRVKVEARAYFDGFCQRGSQNMLNVINAHKYTQRTKSDRRSANLNLIRYVECN